MIGRRALGLSMAGLVAGCGFHPLYQAGSGGGAALGSVYVSVIPNRSGQLLRQALQARLEGAQVGSAKRYTLSIAYFELGQGVGVQANNFTTRIRSTGVAAWSLHSVANAASPLTGGTARRQDGYNLLDEQYFYADLSEEAVQRRLAEALADQIATDLSLYFDKHPEIARGA